MANDDGTPSNYDIAMGEKFVMEFNERRAEYHNKFAWNDLPPTVKTSLMQAFYKVIDEIQGDMY